MPKVGDGTGMDKKYEGPTEGLSHYGGDTAEPTSGATGRSYDSPGAMHDGPQRTSLPEGRGPSKD